MSLRSVSLGIAAATLLCILPAAQAPAVSMSLADLIGGQTIQSDDGSLTFSNFAVTFFGKIKKNPALYTVSSLPNGLQISGNAKGRRGGMVVEYDVAGPIDGLGLEILARKGRGGANVDVEGGPSVSASHGKKAKTPAKQQQTFAQLAGGDLDELIRLGGGARGFSAAVSFGTGSPVPEPGVLAMLGLGLAGLAVAGRRR
jgi:hypothetical protein